MGVNLRLPNITGLSEKEQILQIKNYLYQLVGELQFALSDSGSASSSVVVLPQQSSATVAPSTSIQSIFSSLKPLIIKSADIVSAYYDQLSTKFEGKYVAQSDFGTYTEETQQVIEETSAATKQAFTNIQTIDTDLQDAFTKIGAVDTKIAGEVSGIKQNVEVATKALSESIDAAEKELAESISGVATNLGDQLAALTKSVDAILSVNAYIKSGLLYYNDDELPVYGVEVGQTNSVNGEDVYKKFARFTADKLSFYDQNDQEVAYVSDYKLYITSVEILYNLIGGGFMLDFSRGFTLKFAGGE